MWATIDCSFEGGKQWPGIAAVGLGRTK